MYPQHQSEKTVKLLTKTVRKLVLILLFTVICAIPCYAVTEYEVDKDTGETNNKEYVKVFKQEFDKENLKTDLEESGYTIVGETSDSLTVISDFSSKRLISDKFIESYKDAVIEHWNDMTILGFKTEKETRSAYEDLINIYGEGSVVPDVMTKAEKCWGEEFMGLPEYKEITSNSNEKIKVAVLDSGIDLNHQRFEGREIETHSRSEYSVFDPDNDSVEDYNGHGTAVAGIIAENTPDNVSLMSVKIADDRGYTSVYDMMKGTELANKCGADVINISYCAELDLDEYEKYVKDKTNSGWVKEFQDAVDNGVVICTSSGNEMRFINDEKTCVYPAVCEQVLAIGAIDQECSCAIFSNFGDELDFCAPGQSVEVALPDDKYEKASGTSFASPYVAAYSANVLLDHKNATPDEVTGILQDNAIDLGLDGKDKLFGYGYPKYIPAGQEELSNHDIECPEETEYTGQAITPKINIQGLIESVHYVVSYENNVMTGTGIINIKGKGPYKDTAKQFEILPAKIKPVISLSMSKFYYNGKVQQPKVTVKCNHPCNTDIPQSKKPGIYKVKTTVTDSCYTGSAVKTYKILPQKPKVKVKRKGNKTYLKFTKGCQIKYKGKTYNVKGNRKTLKGKGKIKIRKYIDVQNTRLYSQWVTIKAKSRK